MRSYLPVLLLSISIVITVSVTETTQPTINNFKFNLYFYMAAAFSFALLNSSYSRMVDRYQGNK